MKPPSPSEPTDRPWLHFWGLVLLLTVVQLSANAVLAEPTPGLGSLLRLTAASMFVLLPVAAGVAAGAVMGRSRRVLVEILALTYLLMVVADLSAIAGTPIRTPEPTLAQSQGTVQRIGLERDLESVSLIRGLVGAATGEPTSSPQVLESNPAEDPSSLPSDHPRMLAVRMVTKVGLFLGVIAAMGVVLGTRVWMSERVIFKSTRDELVASLVAAWILSPLVVLGAFHWSIRMRHDAVFGGQPLLLILFPYLPILVLGALGWRLGLRYLR